jgi:glycine/D-amino acid oxidase-like deaminating enzyme
MSVDGVPAEIGFKKNGYLFIVPQAGREVLRRNFDMQREMGCNVVWLEPDELQGRYPSMHVSDLGAGVLSPDDGWLDPHGVLMGFRNKARSLGAEFLADEVVGLDLRGPSVSAARLASDRLNLRSSPRSCSTTSRNGRTSAT